MQAPSADALLAAIVDATDDAILSVDPEGRIVTWNRGAAALYGHRTEDVVGSPVSLVVEDPDEWAAAFGRVLQGEHLPHRPCRRRHRDGWVLDVGETLSPVRGPDGAVVAVAAVAHDISERVAVERDLDALRTELEVKNRSLERSNEELEQFAYVASHDLSEPLRAVAGMVGLLARRYQGRFDDDADEFIAFAVDGCERMRVMIEDLLAYSRAGRVELSVVPVDLERLVGEVLDALSAQVERTGATIAVGPLPTVRGDASQLRQVLQNLIGNALKFGRPGSPPRVEVRADEAPEAWRISVIDDGIGIEPRYRTRIFRMFQRLHPRDRYEGTGIGLAIAERIVVRHGGTIGVSANEADGSTFWFTVPHVPTEHP